MREVIGPPLRAAALLAFLTGLVFLLLNPPSLSGAGTLLAICLGAVVIAVITA